MPIPPILHQMWRDDSLPEQWVRFRETWIKHHPHWQHFRWTDATLRPFVEEHYPDFLPTYDGYPEGIMRADAARYLLLHHFGGVYTDMDTECLRPLESLLEGERLLLPLEPDAHVFTEISMKKGVRRIVGNAWMASEPGHPFWQFVISRMKANRSPGPLDATGPFLLSAAVDAWTEFDHAPRLLPAEVVQPATNTDGPWLRARAPGSPHWYGRQTYALHYWQGTWWRPNHSLTRLFLMSGKSPLVTGHVDEAKTSAHQAGLQATPLVSCLMITGVRRPLAELAALAFRRQTYANRELVVIDDSGRGIPDWVKEDDDGGRIRWIEVPAEGRPLGALRNLALAEARGDLLCQWDDDDLSTPTRLERQVLALHATGAHACGLNRLQMWWPARDRMAISSNRIWECALMWRRGTITAYPELRAGEDTPPVVELAAKGRIAMIDAPNLYTYICHGQNTFSAGHWESLWVASRQRWEGAACRLRLQIMQPSLPLDEYLQALNLPGVRDGAEVPVVEPETAVAPVLTPRSFDILTRDTSNRSKLPTMLIATPVKDAVPFLERFITNVVATDYPAEKLSIALLEGDSQDATAAYAAELLKNHCGHLASARLFQRNFGYQLAKERWAPHVQRQRRSVLARSRNALVELGLEDEGWIMWIDSDVHSWPTDVFLRLLETGKQIVTPHCVRGSTGGPSFDQNAFVFKDAAKQDGAEYLLDGLYQPPVGVTRRYLQDFRDQKMVQLDSVGGTMLLVQADLHRGGMRFPALPYEGYIETEGLARMAKAYGASCWGLPQVEIIHH